MVNQRGRGLKLKRALQFSALLGVCIWLLYQITHPHHHNTMLFARKLVNHRNESKSDLEGGKVGYVDTGTSLEMQLRNSREDGIASLDKERELENDSSVENRADFDAETNILVLDEHYWHHHHHHHHAFDDENGVPFGLNDAR